MANLPYGTPPRDFPSDLYERKLRRKRPEYRFLPGIRNDIWLDWADGCNVGEFMVRARTRGGGPEDLRIYVWRDLVNIVPPLTAEQRSRFKEPREVLRQSQLAEIREL